MKLFSWALSDVGRKREHNEDSLLLAPELGLFGVADGMGGHLGGDQASRMAVEIVGREVRRAWEASSLALERTAEPSEAAAPTIPLRDLDTSPVHVPGPSNPAPAPSPPPAKPATPAVKTAVGQASPPAAALVLRESIRSASRAIHRMAQADDALRGMGTTLTLLRIEEERAYVAHVGDSRGYLYRDGKVRQLTEDHSWIHEQVKAGLLTDEEARDSRWRHIITRSVGVEKDVRVDLQQLPLSLGDCFILCTDGLSNYLGAEELAHVMAAHYYRRIPRLLVELANERGGDDNISLVLVYAANDQ